MRPDHPPLAAQLHAAMEPERERVLRMISKVAQEAGERVAEAPLTAQRVAEIVAGAQSTMDQEIGDAAAQGEQQLGRKVGCAKGCHRCCFQTIEVSTVEVVALVARIPEQDRPGVAAMAAVEAERVASLSRSDRYRQGVSCLFLEGQDCGIYDARPSVCRGYLSYSRLACRKDWSERFQDNRRGGVPLLAETQILAGIYAQGVDIAMARAGLEVEHVEISRAVAVLALPGAIGRWLAGERLFEGWRHRNPHSGLSHGESIEVIASNAAVS
ncbi:MAG: YkgJ family cysteine cluster protein [Pseudomonadota bacterium]